ncbi:MAG: hypothetical protein WCQ77_13275 [Planctomycetota bacterium]
MTAAPVRRGQNGMLSDRPILEPAFEVLAVCTICSGFFTTVLPELVRQGIVTLDASSATR